MYKVNIRDATKNDAEKIGLLHALSWKIAYRNLLPDAYLDDNLDQERINYWAGKLQTLTAKDFVLVAESHTFGFIGFIAVMDQPEKGYEALIDNLHVHPGHKRHGIGKTLMTSAARRLMEGGIQNVYLWVLDGNEKAEKFYKARGGKPADTGHGHPGVPDVPRTRFVWDNLDELIKP